MGNKKTREELAFLQALPLHLKVRQTEQTIRFWFHEYSSYISFSGGKDSTVLLDIARKAYGDDFPAVFADTGLEYPEIREFVKSFDNVEIVKPTHRKQSISFIWVVQNHGYPLIGKEAAKTIREARNGAPYALEKIHGKSMNENGEKSMYNYEKYSPLLDVPFKISDACCRKMKKSPFEKYERKTGKRAITAEMAEESLLRTQKWLQNGCNAFDGNRPKSTPMAFWTEQDVLQYIKQNNLPIASVYGDIVYANNSQLEVDEKGNIAACDKKLCTTGCQRTGCVFCAFGAHLEKGINRFQRLKQTHPKLYEYCIGGGEWNGKMWQPSEQAGKKGLGMGYVFDTLNDIYGKGFLPYE